MVLLRLVYSGNTHCFTFVGFSSKAGKMSDNTGVTGMKWDERFAVPGPNSQNKALIDEVSVYDIYSYTIFKLFFSNEYIRVNVWGQEKWIFEFLWTLKRLHCTSGAHDLIINLIIGLNKQSSLRKTEKAFWVNGKSVHVSQDNVL